MAVPAYFFEPDITGSQTQYPLSAETSKHCVQVLRMQTGASLQLTDGKGSLYSCVILQADKKQAVVSITEQSFLPKTTPAVTLAVSPIKNPGRFEWLLEKATETGIQKIHLLDCERTEKHRLRADRLQGVLVAAMLQSQQCWLPELSGPFPFSKYVREAHAPEKLIAHCLPGEKKKIACLPYTPETIILIGPEGDFSPGETDQAIKHGFVPVTLGNTRLRTETAGIVASSLLMNRVKA